MSMFPRNNNYRILEAETGQQVANITTALGMGVLASLGLSQRSHVTT